MIYFTPGPTQLHPCVEPAIMEALKTGVCSISHRSQEFQDIYARSEAGVRKVMVLPEDWQVFFIGSATQAMERVLQNGVSKKSHHLVNGTFSERMYRTAEQLNIEATVEVAPLGEIVRFDEGALPEGVELISYALNETSTGVWNGMEMAARLRLAAPDALISLDVVSAVPYATIDYSQIDVAFFSVQKGFGLPAGLGVMLVSPRALGRAAEKRARGESIGSYHSYLSMAESAKKHYTVETPNVLALYLLGVVTDELLAYGLDRIREETEEKAAMIYDFLTSSSYEPFVKNSTWRSPTMAVVEYAGDQASLHQALKEAGYQIGMGYGDLKDTTFRIANFPMHTKDDLSRILEILEAHKNRP